MDGVPDKVAEAVRIEPMVLTEEMVRTPSDIAYWNERYSNVYQAWLEAKYSRERVFADLSKATHASLIAQKGKATIAEVESLVLTDPEYVKARSIEIVTETEKVRLGGVMEALRAKKDMLISIGAHMRAEMGGDLSTRRTTEIDREIANNRR